MCLMSDLPSKLSLFIAGENDVFGDNICHESTVGQSAVDVLALTYCDLHWIQRDALIEVLEFYPEFANKFTKNLVLSYNLRDEVKGGFLIFGGSLVLCMHQKLVVSLSLIKVGCGKTAILTSSDNIGHSMKDHCRTLQSKKSDQSFQFKRADL